MRRRPDIRPGLFEEADSDPGLRWTTDVRQHDAASAAGERVTYPLSGHLLAVSLDGRDTDEQCRSFCRVYCREARHEGVDGCRVVRTLEIQEEVVEEGVPRQPFGALSRVEWLEPVAVCVAARLLAGHEDPEGGNAIGPQLDERSGGLRDAPLRGCGCAGGEPDECEASEWECTHSLLAADYTSCYRRGMLRRLQTMRLGVVGLVGCLLAGLAGGGEHASAQDPGTWNPETAAAYLDARQEWWMDWPTAARDRGTFCVSCHTTTPYALARTVLRLGAREAMPGAVEQRLLENVETRVTAWQEVEPFYSDEQYRVPKTSESRGTESILNALILANRDARAGSLSDTTRRAFDNLWALQVTSGEAAGAWPWLVFGLEPWEVPASQYYGARRRSSSR